MLCTFCLPSCSTSHHLRWGHMGAVNVIRAVETTGMASLLPKPSHNLARLKHLYQVDKKWAALSCHTGPVYIINTTCTWNFRLRCTTAIDAKLCIIWSSKFKLVKLTNYLPTNITPNYLQASQNTKVISKWVRDGKNSKEYESKACQ